MNPFLVKDIVPGSESSNPKLLGKVNGDLLFTTFDHTGSNTKLWKAKSRKAFQSKFLGLPDKYYYSLAENIF